MTSGDGRPQVYEEVEGDGTFQAVEEAGDGCFMSYQEIVLTEESETFIAAGELGGGTYIAIFGLGGDDRLFGQDFGLSIFGGDGDDRILGRGQSDDLFGDAGNDLIRGNQGDDRITGGEGDDELYGGGGRDQVNGGEGNDEIEGNVSEDVLRGGLGDDHLDGGNGRDSLRGNGGDDQLNGGAGGDLLIGGRGDDGLTGGAGPDVFYFGGEFGDDLVTDLTLGEDILRIAGMDYTVVIGRGDAPGFPKGFVEDGFQQDAVGEPYTFLIDEEGAVGSITLILAASDTGYELMPLS